MRSLRGALALTIAGGIAVLGVVVACGSDGASSEGGDVPLPDRVDPGDAVGCAPRCADDATLAACDDAGKPTSMPCPLGCNVAAARCLRLDPSGVATPDDLSAATAPLDLSAAGAYTLSTDDGSIRGPNGDVAGIAFRVADQPGGPKVGIFAATALTLGAQSTLRVTGANAGAILVATDATIDGTLSAAGDCEAGAPGPGGYAHDDGPSKGERGKVATCATTSSGVVNCAGGGGGGGSGAGGGSGGNVGNAAGGGDGGAAYATGTFALVGGSGGASAGVGSGVGGAGGGALQIAAGGSVRVNGTIDAAGCGGKLGATVSNGGGGGGAGGMIVLEGATVTVGGKVVANGGGGASGSSSAQTGAGGAQGTEAALGGAGGAANACAGGRGGGGEAGAAPGTSCNLALGGNKTAAGGGGAVGRLVVRGTLSGTAQVLSPAPDVGPAATN